MKNTHKKVSKISQNIPIILFWVKKVVKKGVLREWGFRFGLGFWGLTIEGTKFYDFGRFWKTKKSGFFDKKRI